MKRRPDDITDVDFGVANDATTVAGIIASQGMLGPSWTPPGAFDPAIMDSGSATNTPPLLNVASPDMLLLLPEQTHGTPDPTTDRTLGGTIR